MIETASKILFWTFAGLILYVYIGYPLLLAFFSLFFRRRPAEPDNTPSISVLVAAYNEAASIGQKITQTLQLDYPSDQIEIIVLSDSSTDGTDEIVRQIRDSRVRLLRMPERGGKTNAQNHGVQAAKGEILIFSDATTIYHPMALRYLVSNYRDPSVGAVSGRYQYFDETGRSPTGLGTVAFWNYENLIKKFQSQIKTISGCCGCIYSVRKSAYTPLDPDIISDLVQPLMVLKQGLRVIFEDRALAYEETTQSSSEEFSMRVRVVTRAIHGILRVSELLNPFRYSWISVQLLSHKVLRWIVPFFLIGIFLSNLALLSSSFYLYVFVAQVLLYGSALLSLVLPLQKVSKLLTVPLYFCTVNSAALVSVIEVIRGNRYVVWETVRK
jgi:cellulose synthase/poly-beta-1,6-N-acetylglucosamine synthase-like glycosyltransferase